ncbi:MAG: hypothetical protein QXI12_06460 [Candidatus Methanomethyliaceae archaeon]
MCTCGCEQLFTFMTPANEPIALMSEVFPQRYYADETKCEQPGLRLRVSYDYHSLEIYFGNFESALAMVSAIQDMVEDGLKAIAPHSNLTPRVRTRVPEPPLEQSAACMPF